MPYAVELSIVVDGEVQMKRQLRGITMAIDDMSPAMARIGDVLQQSFERAFETEGASNESGKWAPLSKRYKAWKDKRYPGKPILTRTERLRKAAAGKGPGLMRRIRAKSVTVGTDVRVGKWELGQLHQKGTTQGMPARRIISLSRKTRSAIMRELRIHIYKPTL